MGGAIDISGERKPEIEMDESINPETTSFPPMLFQPFIENSIEHGFIHKDSKGNIDISFNLRNKTLFVEVQDDRIGREKAKNILKNQNINPSFILPLYILCKLYKTNPS